MTRHIAIVGAVLVILGSGCVKAGVSGQSCDQTSDCKNGDRCDNHLCLPAGGSSGAGTSGSGSTGTTGSTGTSGSSGSSGSTTGRQDAGPPCGGPCSRPGDYCDMRTDGGACTPAYAVSFVAPGSGTLIDGGPQTAVVHVAVVSASNYGQPAQVVLSVGCDGGGAQLSQPDGGNWFGTFSSNVDGTLQLCAAAYWLDAGHVGDAGEAVTVDVTAPTLAPSLSRDPVDFNDPSGPDGGAFARDEDPVTIDANASDAHLMSVTYALLVDGGSAGGLDPNTGVLTLQTPPLEERAIYTVVVTATDAVGNQSSKTVAVPVTRWKWTATLPVSGNNLLAPAVGHDGTIYEVATVSSGTAPNVFALNLDGGVRWSATVPHAPVAGAALAPDAGVLFVLDGQEMSLLRSVDGGISHGAIALTGPSTPAPEFSVAFAPASSGLETAFVVGKSNNAVLTGIGSDGTTHALGFNGVASSGNYAFGSQANVGLSSGSTRSYEIVDFTGTLFRQLDGGTINESLKAGPYGDSSEAFLAGGGGVQLLHVDLSGASPIESPGPLTLLDTISGEVLIPAAGMAVVAVGPTKLVEVSVGSVMTPRNLSLAAGDTGMLLATTSLYALSGPVATAVDYGSPGATGASRWQVDLSQLGSVVATAAPSLMCSAHSTSWLLVPTNGALVALVIDEAGLSTTAPWPKYRRDFANSANAGPVAQACQ
jgi:hypothetical protein